MSFPTLGSTTARSAVSTASLVSPPALLPPKRPIAPHYTEGVLRGQANAGLGLRGDPAILLVRLDQTAALDRPWSAEAQTVNSRRRSRRNEGQRGPPGQTRPAGRLLEREGAPPGSAPVTPCGLSTGRASLEEDGDPPGWRERRARPRPPRPP